jgi:hypothetical protein
LIKTFPKLKTYKTSTNKKTSTEKIKQSNNTIPASNKWISVSKASEITGFNKGVISRLASKGVIINNGKKYRTRRLLKSSVLVVLQEREEKEHDRESRKEYFRIKAIKKQITD